MLIHLISLDFASVLGNPVLLKCWYKWENVHYVIYFKPQGPILSCNIKMKWFTLLTRTWNRKTMLARIMCCVNAAETLPPPSEMTKVTFTTWDQEVRDEKNAFLFSLFCLRETSMFIPEWNGMFFCNIQTELVEQMETQNNQKLKNTLMLFTGRHGCRQVMFAMWLIAEGVDTMLLGWYNTLIHAYVSVATLISRK